jgi:hypothetical protein
VPAAREALETLGSLPRTAGYSDGEIAEIITNVGLNTFTNYFNNAVQAEIDFPKIDLKKAA